MSVQYVSNYMTRENKDDMEEWWSVVKGSISGRVCSFVLQSSLYLLSCYVCKQAIIIYHRMMAAWGILETKMVGIRQFES